MYLLTISSFLRTVIIIVIVAYGVKFLMRYVFPNMVQNYVDKKINDLKKEQGVSEAEAQRIKKEQGKVKISQNPAKDGEYVDYEEVK
jgi:hypothetical protein